MADILFDEDNEFHIKSRKLLGEPETPSMIRLLLKSGLVKNEKQALIVLVVIIILCVGATWWVLSGRNNQIDYIEGPDGRRYSIEEYFQLVDSGNDPLSPDEIRKYQNQ